MVYRVQIAASVNKPIQNQTKLWSGIDDLEVVNEASMHKYLTGQFSQIALAEAHKNKMRAKGFKGAFVVAYQAGNRVKL